MNPNDLQTVKLSLVKVQTDFPKSHLELAQEHIKNNRHHEAAMEFVLAKDFAKAGKMFETIFDFKSAIQNYVKADQIQTAGDLLIRLGEKKKAARLFERAKKMDLAIKYYKETESFPELIELYLKCENYFDAFKISFKIKDFLRATEIAKKIAKNNIHYIHSHIYLMTERLEQKDFSKVLEIFLSCFLDQQVKFDDKTLSSCAEILESSGHFKQALEVYYQLLNQQTNNENIYIKIKALEKRFQKNYTFPKLKSYTNRFQLYEKIGSGAMGNVYKARDLSTDDWVALKTLSTKLQDEEILTSFLQEARTVHRLNHANITKIYDYGIENDHYFISMEYLVGKNLKEIISKIGALNIKDFLSVAIPLVEGLAYAHEMHTIHRDIKPSNIMLLKDRSVKIMDFGISKITQFSDYKSIARGTPIYVSPEQILGIQTTKQSDLYSLGVVFYEMLSGSPPFTGGDILSDHIHKPVEELGKENSKIPYKIINIVMSCLAKKPDRRPVSAQKILEQLKSIEI